MADACPASRPTNRSTRLNGRLAAAVLLLIGLAAVLQGRSVGYGLVLDDFNHRAEMRDGDWSFHSLVNASHLGDPRRRVRMWWQDEADLHFFRPVAFAIMRATYVAGGWRPEIMHVASIGWGAVCASLVLLLARRATGSLGWGLLAAVVFLAHPNNFLTPRWIACQNEQMATAFTLAALLFYGGYSGWWEASACRCRAKLAAAALCYIAALGCRESAIILPVLLVVGDLSARPASRDRKGAVNLVFPYVFFATIAIAYLVLRRQTLGPLMIPGRPYAWPASEPGFLTFVAEKFVYYVLGLWAYIPIIGFVGQEQMRENPGIFYGLFAAIVVVWALVLTVVLPRVKQASADSDAARGARQIWLWLALALLPLGPVLPVFASAHHLYLVSAGMAIGTVIALRGVLQWTRQRVTVLHEAIRMGLVGVVPLLLFVFAGANFALDTGVAGLAAACQLPTQQAIQLGRSMKADDKLFFINLPMLAFNCMPAIEEARGVSPLHGYVLTFAPDFIRMDRQAHVEQLDAHRLRVWLDEPAYFSGMIGQSILQGIHRNSLFKVGEQFNTDEFTVDVTEATEAGIQEFVFKFKRPLNDPTYHFFLSSPIFDVYPIAFK